MAETKKRSRKTTGTADNLITVDATRLREALRHTFEGVTMLFDCIGLNVPVGEPVVEQEEKPAEKDTEELPDFIPAEESKPVPAEEQRGEQSEAPEEPVQTDPPVVTNVTQDDITRIIVRKIKQDRSNNEKIGAILKTYNVCKVSDLPASKYEAFLTDLSQI